MTISVAAHRRRTHNRWLRRGLLPVQWLLCRKEVQGIENLPREGPFLVVLNHQSVFDLGVLLIDLPGIDWNFLVGEKWRTHGFFGPFLRRAGGIFVDRDQPDLSTVRSALRVVREGGVLGIAPEGQRSPGGLQRAKDGAAFLASRARVPLVPVGITGTERVHLDVRRGRRGPVRLTVGPPFVLPPTEDGRLPGPSELAAGTELIMAHIAALLPESYRGDYARSPALAALLAGHDPWPACLDVAQRASHNDQ